jgi:hypothetical protein
MDQHQPAEAKQVKVVLRRGDWEVEVTCPEDRVQQVIESVLAGLSSQTATPGQTPVEPIRAAAERRSVTIRTLLEDLWREGWFGEPRSLAEVDDEIGRRGYHYDRTAVAHTLTDLVREGVLSREGQPRTYRYVQKRPPD